MHGVGWGEAGAMRILVTGGAGYIGSVTADKLLKAGHHVRILDDLSHGHREAVPQGAELVVAGLADRECLDRLFRETRFDGVMHFAAFIEAGESMKSPETFFRNNTANALTVLETMLAHGVKKFVFSSTAALYGNPIRTPIEEDDPLQPTNAYGESKLLVERMLSWFHRIHGLRYASLRYFNAAGAASPQHGEAHQPETHLIPIAVEAALGLRPELTINGTDYPTPDGACVRDYIHVSDLAAAHLAALDLEQAAGDFRAFNVGTGRGYSVLEVIAAIGRAVGKPVVYKLGPRRAGDPASVVADPARANAELGWRAERGLDAIVESAIAWRRAPKFGRFPDVAQRV